MRPAGGKRRHLSPCTAGLLARGSDVHDEDGHSAPGICRASEECGAATPGTVQAPGTLTQVPVRSPRCFTFLDPRQYHVSHGLSASLADPQAACDLPLFCPQHSAWPGDTGPEGGRLLAVLSLGSPGRPGVTLALRSSLWPSAFLLFEEHAVP